MTDPISDTLIRIKNAYMAGKKDVTMPGSNMKKQIIETLKRHRFVDDCQEIDNEGHRELIVNLRYEDGSPAVEQVDIVSKPGIRVYSKIKKIKYVKAGKGIVLISTPKGILSDKEARKQNVGGEIICKIW